MHFMILFALFGVCLIVAPVVFRFMIGLLGIALGFARAILFPHTMREAANGVLSLTILTAVLAVGYCVIATGYWMIHSVSQL